MVCVERDLRVGTDVTQVPTPVSQEITFIYN